MNITKLFAEITNNRFNIRRRRSGWLFLGCFLVVLPGSAWT